MTTSVSTSRVAAVDIGSNTLHLIVADISVPEHIFAIIDRQVELVRLGADVAATGAIGPERAARACATLQAMAERARQAGAQTVIGLATEGVRAASNAQAMIASFSAALGFPIALVSGMEEAALTFWGATSESIDPAERLGVGDLGGGSCELITGTTAKIATATSIKLGSGALMAAAHPSDPPTSDDFAQLAAMARAALQPVPLPTGTLARLLAVGGTATALGRFAGQATTLDQPIIARAQAQLGSHAVAELAAQTGIDTERLRLLVGGVVAWQAIMEHLHVNQLTVSERGVREGAIMAWARAGDDWVAYARAAVAGL